MNKLPRFFREIFVTNGLQNSLVRLKVEFHFVATHTIQTFRYLGLCFLSIEKLDSFHEINPLHSSSVN